MSYQTAAVYGLRVPCDGMPVPAAADFPATFRITMAAIDPTAKPIVGESHVDAPHRATLKIIRAPFEDEDDEDWEDDDDDDDIEAIERRLGAADSGSEEESSDDDDDEKNGGPSDPAKSKKARKEAALKEILEALKEQEDEDVDMDGAVNGVNGKVAKGKARASDEDEEEEEDSADSSESDEEIQEFVLCTLDPENHYQQPIDITVGERENVYFQVNGTHTVYLTGNYIIPHQHDDFDQEDEDDEEYGLAPFNEDELSGSEGDSEEDELDDLEDPRIQEIESDEEEAPKLIKAADKKNKNKRAAESDDEDEPALDDLIAKSLKPEATNGEEKLSKKQRQKLNKKLKNNAGEAVPAEQDKPTPKKEESSAKDSPANGKSDKKVQFAKNLEQGPTSSPKTAETKKDSKKDDTKSKPALGVKVVQGVKIDDKKLGTGKAAKKGDKVAMRYIGKLEKDNKQFDANKKGKPFTFKLGHGEVIKGWDIGIEGITVGGERRITVPAHLGYGSKGMPSIPANSNLVFDVKCLSIN